MFQSICNSHALKIKMFVPVKANLMDKLIVNHNNSAELFNKQIF